MNFDFLPEYSDHAQTHPSLVHQQMRALTGDHYCSVENTHTTKDKAIFLHSQIGSSSINYLSYGQEVDVRATKPCSMYHIQIVTRGRCEIRSEGRCFTANKHNAVIINPTGNIKVTYSPDCEKVVVLVDPETVKKELYEITRRPIKTPIVFQECFDISSSPGLDLVRLISHMTHDMFSESSFYTASNCLSQSAEKLLIQYLLRSIDNTHSYVIFKAEAEHQPAWLINIDAYIDNNIREAITPEALAKATNLNIRTMYERFKHHQGISPMAYVKKLKLEKARQELKKAHLTGKSVTDIAMEFQFTHLGRFSAEYKKEYHELPSHTVRS